MKKHTKKILLSVGALTSIITPMSIALSCGSQSDQDKLNGITIDMVKSALNVTPSSTTLPSAATKPTTTTDVTLNGLEGVTITISGVTTNDDDGTLTATATVSKKGLTSPKPLTITWKGFATSQALMDGITSAMVKTALKYTPDSTKAPSAATQPATKHNVTINGLAGVTITINNIIPQDGASSLTATAAVSKGTLTPPSGNPFTITWTGFKPSTLTDQEKMNGITGDIAKLALNYTLDKTKLPSAATKPPTTPQILTLNGLAGVTITLTNVTPDDDAGTLTAQAAISKIGLNPPTGSPFTITWNGFFSHNQEKMNGITADMVRASAQKYYGINPDPNSPVSQFSPDSSKSNPYQDTLNSLGNVNVEIKLSTDIFNDKTGTLSLNIAVSKTGLTPPSKSPFTITWTGWKKLSDQAIMNNITGPYAGDEIQILFDYKVDSTKLPSEAKNTIPKTKNVSINGLTDVTITLSDITADDAKGTLTAQAAISKTGLTPPTGSPFTITWSGFKHN